MLSSYDFSNTGVNVISSYFQNLLTFFVSICPHLYGLLYMDMPAPPQFISLFLLTLNYLYINLYILATLAALPLSFLSKTSKSKKFYIHFAEPVG